MYTRNFKIAIDGFSSCGKSTLARQLAEKLDAVYIDSGAMYRAATLLAMHNGCIQEGELLLDSFQSIVSKSKFSFDTDNNHILLNEKDVENKIRQADVADLVSLVAQHGFVRKQMVTLQQEFAKDNSVVMDGRDIGTHVFPNAELKLFLTADPKIRAHRRFLELREKGMNAEFTDILENVKMRDYMDQNREVAPLKKAPDAIEIDNSNLSREQQLEKAYEYASLALKKMGSK